MVPLVNTAVYNGKGQSLLSVTAFDAALSEPMAIGERIDARLRELGMTRAELARALDESPQRIGHYVNGKRKPEPEMLAKIAARLGVTPASLDADGRVSLAQVGPIVRQLCELSGLSPERAAVVAEATAEALRLLSLLPEAGAQPGQIDLLAQAAWHTRQH
jgi:transcriptional regulator with XRE-family HTH domain